MNKKKVSAIVLAAGNGSRMQSSLKKQFMPLLGYPLIYYSLFVFQSSDEIDEIILVTGKEDIKDCQKQLVDRYQLTKVKKIIAGGKERYLSVYEGLKAIEQADYVLIHDGARPILEKKYIKQIVDTLKKGYSCALAVPVKDTIKRVDEQNYAIETPNRKELWMMQTPQAFPYQLIFESYQKAIEEKLLNLTDDAMVLEKIAKQSVKLLEGSYKNIKVTTPEDLKIAELFVNELV